MGGGDVYGKPTMYVIIFIYSIFAQRSHIIDTVLTTPCLSHFLMEIAKLLYFFFSDYINVLTVGKKKVPNSMGEKVKIS